MAVALYLTGDRSGAELQWFRVEDARYSDRAWLEQNRHWPPRLIDGMENFIKII